MRNTVIAALALLAVAGAAPMARAQKPVSPPKSLTPSSAPVNKLGVPQVAKTLPKGSRAVRTVSTQSATSFRPSGTRMILPALVAKMDGTDEEKAAMGKQLEGIFTAYESQARRLGMENDIAGALSFFLATHYSVYKGGAKVSDTAKTAIFRQFQGALDSDKIRGMSDADKQQAYETLVLTSAITLLQYRAAVEAKDKDAIREVRRSAGETLSGLVKAEPDQVSITDEGMSISKAGAASPGKDFGN